MTDQLGDITPVIAVYVTFLVSLFIIGIGLWIEDKIKKEQASELDSGDDDEYYSW